MSDDTISQNNAENSESGVRVERQPSIRLKAADAQPKGIPVETDVASEHRRGIEILLGIIFALVIVLVFVARNAQTGSELLQSGMQNAKTGDPRRAIYELTTCLTISGAPLKAYEYRALAHSRNGDHGMAIADYTRVLAAEPENVEAYMGRGCDFLQNLDYQPAYNDFTRVLKLRPSLSEAYRLRAAAAWKMGQYDHVVKDCRSYLQSGDSLPAENRLTTLVLLASAMLEMGKTKDAIDACAQAIAINVKDPRPLEMRARIFRKQNKLKDAIADCTKAIAIAPTADLYRLRADCHLDEGNRNLALNDLNEAIKLAPADLKARNQRAQLALLMRNYQLAMDDAKYTLAAAPTNKTADEILTKVRKATGMDKVKVIATEPADQEEYVRTDINYVGGATNTDTYKGYRLLATGRDSEAIPILTAALKKNPNDVMARKYLAHALLGIGAEGDSLRQFDILAKTVGLSPEDRLAVARAADKTGDDARSFANYEEYLSINPLDAKARLELVEKYQRAGQIEKSQTVARAGIRMARSSEERVRFGHLIREPGANLPIEQKN